MFGFYVMSQISKTDKDGVYTLKTGFSSKCIWIFFFTIIPAKKKLTKKLTEERNAA